MPARTRAVLTAAVTAVAAAALSLPTAAAAPRAAADCTATLWAAGTGGYASYRIPAIVQVDGTLVAFAEGRRSNSSDSGDIEVVSRRSTDGGCSWTPTQVVADAWHDTVDNAVPIATDSGALVLITNWQRGTVTQAEIVAGQVPPVDGRRIFVQRSTDAGATWTARREITSSVKRADWLWYATGPGHGTVIENGTAVGRLVLAADHSELGPLRGVHTLLSDDDGQSWRIGASDDHTDGVINPDETTLAELPDGRLYLSARNQDGTGPNRAYTYSLSSGSTFSAPFRPAPAITTPVVEGSLLQDPGLPAGVSCAPLLYSGPEDPAVRRHLTVRRSDDGGQSWRTITEVTGQDDPAAYSDLVKVDRTHLGVVYENGNAGPYERITFRSYILGCP